MRTYPWLYTTEGHLDPTWLMVAVTLSVMLLGFVGELVLGHPISAAAWAAVAAMCSSLLIAAVPVSKARLLAKATMPGSVAQGIASALEQAGVRPPTSADQGDDQ